MLQRTFAVMLLAGVSAGVVVAQDESRRRQISDFMRQGRPAPQKTVEADEPTGGGVPAGPIADGLAWLGANQNPDGSWGSSFELIVTSTVLDMLTTENRCSAAAATGAVWLDTQVPANFDFQARQAIALAGVPGFEQSAMTLATDLLAARNPVEPDSLLPNWPEGGWGLASGFETDCQTTALALLSLASNGFNGGFKVTAEPLGAGGTNLHPWTIPADAHTARVLISVGGSQIRLCMNQGAPPQPFCSSWFILDAGFQYNLVFPGTFPLATGSNLIVVESTGPAASYSFTASYETPTFDTRMLAEPLDYLREAQNVDGGWGLQRGGDTDLYTSQHVLLALLEYSAYDLATEIADGAAYIRTQQLPDGSFGFGGPGIPYATALAGLDLVGADGASPFSAETADTIGNLLATQDVDGSWVQQSYDTALASLALWNHGEPPTADAGPDQTIADVGEDCVEAVTLNGSGIAINGLITDYVWTEDCVEIATGQSPTPDFTDGDHTVVLTVTDSDGQTASDTMRVSVTATITDTDNDGSPDACNGCTGLDCKIDCDSGNPDVWAEPEEAILALTYSALTGETVITWQDLTVPSEIDDIIPGGSVAVTYDTLRSSDPSDFVTGTTCLETDETDTMAIDTGVVAPGAVDYFIVRVDNDCPGTGSTGSNSLGVPRPVVGCP